MGCLSRGKATRSAALFFFFSSPPPDSSVANDSDSHSGECAKHHPHHPMKQTEYSHNHFTIRISTWRQVEIVQNILFHLLGCDYYKPKKKWIFIAHNIPSKLSDDRLNCGPFSPLSIRGVHYRFDGMGP